MKKCEVCGEVLDDINGGRYLINRKYCSQGCANSKHKYTMPSWRKNVASGTVGAVSELMVCADLSIRGYGVFRSTSPNCSCDILILKEDRVLRVEVRTAFYKKDGELYCNTKGRYDILAKVVIEDNHIEYIPNNI